MRQGVSWQDQWARILRWRQLVRRSRDEPRNDRGGTEGYRDEVFALFQALWHLKDWFKNDDATKQSAGATVEGWLSTPEAMHLLIAADVANGSKHMRVGGPRKRAGGAQQTRNDVAILVGVGVKHTFYVQDEREGGEEYEAVELADLCLQEWRGFLGQQGLREPKA